MSKCPVCDKKVGSENDTMLIHDGCIGEMIIRCERRWRSVAERPKEDGVVVLKHIYKSYMFLWWSDGKYYIPTNDGTPIHQVYSPYPTETWISI